MGNMSEKSDFSIEQFAFVLVMQGCDLVAVASVCLLYTSLMKVDPDEAARSGAYALYPTHTSPKFSMS